MGTDNILRTVGLARKAGRLAPGEEAAADACLGHSCRLLLTAADTGENTLRRAERLAEAGQCLLLRLPYTKEELGGARMPRR